MAVNPEAALPADQVGRQKKHQLLRRSEIFHAASWYPHPDCGMSNEQVADHGSRRAGHLDDAFAARSRFPQGEADITNRCR